MSKILEFHKFQATGNDFIIIDNRDQKFDLSNVTFFAQMCHRNSGVGADGVIFLETSTKNDFKMIYLNADGKEASMCGNGARAITHFASLIFNQKKFQFETAAGIFCSEFQTSDNVRIKWNSITDINKFDLTVFGHKKSFYANTGVPHAVLEVLDVNLIDLDKEASPIRHSKIFPSGTNVNYISKLSSNSFAIRTFERGVEGETLSCGTGTVASALFFSKLYNASSSIRAITRGGELSVEFNQDWSDVFLIGSSQYVYKGQYYY